MAPTGAGVAPGQRGRRRRPTIADMKAILKAALLAALSGMLVGLLLERKLGAPVLRR